MYFRYSDYAGNPIINVKWFPVTTVRHALRLRMEATPSIEDNVEHNE
jgi:hypothetical protein